MKLKRMWYRLLRRTKTLLLTFGLLTLGFYLILNSFADEFSIQSEGSLKKHPRDLSRVDEKSKLSNEFQSNYIAQGQRKPKTMDLANNDPTDNTVIYENERFNNLQSDNNVLKYQHKEMDINSKHTDLAKVKQNAITGKKDFKHVPSENYYNSEEEDENYDPDEHYEDENDYDDDYEDDDNDEDDETDNYQYDDTTNPPFKPGDFGDITGLEYYRKPKLKYAEVKDLPPNKQLNSIKNIYSKDQAHHPDIGYEVAEAEVNKHELVDNGIYWSTYAESLIPKGISYGNVTRLLKHLRSQVVQTLERPGWDKCGRPLNGFAVLSDGTHICVRYRQPHSSFVFGEALSFYLSRLLQMDNVPAVLLARTNSNSSIWRDVNISSLTWEENKMVAFIQWIDNINMGSSSKAYIPPIILEAYRKGTPVTSHVINSSRLLDSSPTHIAEVVQWGTMIIFDYLTGNYDRVASMQDAEEKEKNPKIIEEPIRNLRKSSKDSKLWLIDNESGLFDAYELLEPYHKNSRFTTFHDQMLHTVCVFQSTLVKSLKKLSEYPKPHERLLKFSRSFEPLMVELPKDNLYNQFVETFDKRLAKVMDWIKHCDTAAAG